ncbi:agrin-like [Physella acuta]|uniref:agrin-like n=1 Tax=Physella acuta TaxID=109671 RepID=UPI0027DE1FA3|nr:agrin-like [Physella acuta]
MIQNVKSVPAILTICMCLCGLLLGVTSNVIPQDTTHLPITSTQKLPTTTTPDIIAPGTGNGWWRACKTSPCPWYYIPVCGTNGVTYDNDCYLSRENCPGDEPKVRVRVLHRGACKI